MKTRLFLMTILIMITITSCGSSYNYPEEVEKEVIDSTYQFEPRTFSKIKFAENIPEGISFPDSRPEVIIYSNMNGSPYVGYITNLNIEDGYHLYSDVKTDWVLLSTHDGRNDYRYHFTFLVKKDSSQICYKITMSVDYAVLYSDHIMKLTFISFDSELYPFEMIDKF